MTCFRGDDYGVIETLIDIFFNVIPITAFVSWEISLY